MCRSIKTLRRAEGVASEDEIQAAALQFVRKVSGYRAPSQRNTAAFDAAEAEGKALGYDAAMAEMDRWLRGSSE